MITVQHSGGPRFPPTRAKFRQQAAEYRQMAAARSILDDRAIEYRGKRYVVPPVPYEHGLALQAMVIELNALQSEEWTEGVSVRLVEFCRDAIRLFRRLVKPRGLWRRLFWKVSRNPFHDASEGEIGRLLGFFFSCRTNSTVRHES